MTQELNTTPKEEMSKLKAYAIVAATVVGVPFLYITVAPALLIAGAVIGGAIGLYRAGGVKNAAKKIGGFFKTLKTAFGIVGKGIAGVAKKVDKTMTIAPQESSTDSKLTDATSKTAFNSSKNANENNANPTATNKGPAAKPN
jgi:hypothetical protein